ncbi:MAG: hypothetical protein LCH39_12235 [Proteobacteria bacterium]|nr:hypothetical protein [Pseudomonadota bacterium]
MMFPDDFLKLIPHQLQKNVVCCQHLTVEVKLDIRIGLLERIHDAKTVSREERHDEALERLTGSGFTLALVR